MEFIVVFILPFLFLTAFGISVVYVFVKNLTVPNVDKLYEQNILTLSKPKSDAGKIRDVLVIAFMSRLVFAVAAAVMKGQVLFSQNIYAMWDGAHYLKIAEHGYAGALDWVSSPDGEYGPIFLVFFPLYPMLIKIFSLLTLGNYYVAAMLVSNTAFLAGVVFFYKLLSTIMSESKAFFAVLLLCFSPASQFLGMVYPESLFLLTVCAALYYAQKEKWILVAVFGFLAAFTRLQGILIVIPAFIIWFMKTDPVRLIKEKKTAELLKKSAAALPYIAAAGLGLFIYMVINWIVAGSPLMFLFYQKVHWHNEAVFLTRSLKNLWDAYINWRDSASLFDWNNDYIRFVWGIPIADIFCFALCTVCLIYGLIIRKREYLPFIIYLGIYTYMCFSASWLLSGLRYTMLCIPVYILISDMCSGRAARTAIMTLTCFASAFSFYLFLHGAVY